MVSDGGRPSSGEPFAALRAYDKELAIVRKLADDHPTFTLYQRDLAYCHYDIGEDVTAPLPARADASMRR